MTTTPRTGGTAVADFDAFADTYAQAVDRSIGFSHQPVEFFARRKAAHLVDVCRRHLGDPAQLSVLDVGCGIGCTDQYLTESFGRLAGVDVANEAVERAAARNRTVEYQVCGEASLPLETASCDVAFAACVLHHVPRHRRRAFVREVGRVVRPGGLVVLFEHNPLNPLTRLAVSRCEFDEGVVLLHRSELTNLCAGAALRPLEARYLIFTTWTHELIERAERRLGSLPFGAQHCVAARR